MCRQNPHLQGPTGNISPAIYLLLQCQSSSSSLVRASDQNSEDPGSNPAWISMSFFTKQGQCKPWPWPIHGVSTWVWCWFSSPKISESVNPFQGCATEAVGVMKPFTFICYSHDFAFRLVKVKLPLLYPVIEFKPALKELLHKDLRTEEMLHDHA